MTRRLTLHFDDPVAFRKEYRENIVQGGAFIRTEKSFNLRDAVVVEITLAFADVVTELDAEVVHCVSTEHAGSGNAGVAVQFLLAAADLRDRFERYVPASPARTEAPASPKAPAGKAAGKKAPPAAEEDDDRRSKKRGKARVSAKVETPHLTLDGSTRDLSENGVLLSVDGSDLPVGKEVRLTLVHPDSHERFEVSGRVARHLEGKGTVAAVAIELAGDAPGFDELVRDAHAVDARRRARGIAGSIEELGMGNLVQMFGKFARAGTLNATYGSEEGSASFENGALRHCRLGALTGTKALARLLSWEGGHFEFHSELDPQDDLPAPMPLEAALLEAARQVDEMRRVEPGTLDPNARLRLDAKTLAASEATLTKTEEAVVDLAGAGLTVRRLLDVIPESDAQILEAIRSLAERGLVEILPGDE
jgi:Tfp pilus assembly protein PilZ